MTNDKKRNRFRMKLVRSARQVLKPERSKRRHRPRVAQAKLTTTSQPVVRALKATDGAQDLIAKIPALVQPLDYGLIATFTVCQKTGTALFLDFWDTDLCDGFSDVTSNLQGCRAWFSADGFAFWGSEQTKTGRINCYFRAPIEGIYVFSLELGDGDQGVFKCFIDDESFRTVGPFLGTTAQPYVASLLAGFHHFRIKQESGAFSFVRLTVWSLGGPVLP